jgi:hypothetical protein
MIQKDSNGFVWYVNIFEVMELPDMFASTVEGWLNTDMEAWQKDGTVDSEYYPLQAKDIEQLEARKDMLNDGVGTTPGIETYGRRSLHTD